MKLIDHGAYKGDVNFRYEGDEAKDKLYIDHIKKFKTDIRLGQKTTIANAKYYRVKDSFRKL